jgi:hypothetical protein
MFSLKQIGLITATVAMSGAAVAQEMRCGNELISGDQMNPLLKTQVLELCGEPTSRDGERWYYQQQGKILVFDSDDQLDHIDDANED